MFFETAQGMRPAPLRHNPLNALVMPRPIGWISTVNAEGVPNLAPFSYFNAVCGDPPFVMFAPNGAKDTFDNLAAVPEFVANLVSEADGEAMNATAWHYPPGVDEFAACGVDRAPSRLVRPARVASAKAALECRVFQVVPLPQGRAGENHVVIGQVVGIHIADEVITDGVVDERLLAPLTRLGYMNYGTLGRHFRMPRPAGPE